MLYKLKPQPPPPKKPRHCEGGGTTTEANQQIKYSALSLRQLTEDVPLSETQFSIF
jgi:hypothetical protein